MTDPLTETPLSSETVFDGNLLHVRRDQVRLPDGSETAREYIVHPGAVLVVPLLDDGRLVFERQFRYPLGKAFIELPAGKIDPNEDPLVTGQRELLEETGYTAREWRYLAALHPCIGYSNEIIHIYLATGLTAGNHRRDHDETLETFTQALDEALDMVRRGDITDGKTVIALFWAEKYLNGRWR
ncbi:MAG TPA: NUDIX hydrolase [Novimethylophilus sp.]|jgi:ADP-ribose pyrophosphatase|uniref:NUDIX hydrolase n=1 Tax=Novimethylophilus sp. TaxID=2137426 RepID=UPI002F3F5209